VTVSFSCQPGSGGVTVSSVSAPQILGEGANQFAVGQCIDSLGRISTARLGPVNVDLTVPAVQCASPSAQWLAADAVLGCTATDALSGLAAQGNGQFTLQTSVSSGIETSTAATGSRSACDVAGNCATAGPIGGNRVDRRPPSIAIAAPANNVYVINTQLPADYGCSDGGSGVASCAGPTASGSLLPLGSAGSTTFTVHATDAVGNTSSASVTYQVTYAVRLLFDPERVVKSGSTLPVALQLADAAGNKRVERRRCDHGHLALTPARPNARGAAGFGQFESERRVQVRCAGAVVHLQSEDDRASRRRLRADVRGDWRRGHARGEV
jgi:hypothetical protein